MDFGLFIEFPCREGMTDGQAFAGAGVLLHRRDRRRAQRSRTVLRAMVSRGMVASVALLASGLALSGCVSAPFVSSLESGKLGALRFQSLTVDEEDFLRGRKSGTPVTITGELRLPTTGAERVPAVVLVHGCSGLTSATDGWARELPRFGIATFLVDSFTGRNIREVCTGRDRIATGSRVIDAYRALELLATHPRIDAARIAMMGFSQGGRVALWTAFTRFQDAWGPPTVRFITHLSVYPAACFVTLQGDDRLASVPVRIMHGQADDWTTIGPCRTYVERVRRAGADIAMIEYPGAHHGFDSPSLPSYVRRPDVLNPSACGFVEQELGRIIDPATGRLAGPDAPCFTRGGGVGYHPDAHRKLVRDVVEILTVAPK